MPNVIFRHEDGTAVEVAVTSGENLLEVARKANVAIDAPCSGNGSCGKCRVKYVSGELETEKTRHISDEEFEEGWRLSCLSKVTGDVEVMVPDIASAYNSRMKVADLSSRKEVAIFDKAREEVAESGIAFQNVFSVVDLSMDEPTLDDTMPDNERLIRAVQEATGAEHVGLTYQALKKLPDVLREQQFHVSAVLKNMDGKLMVYDVRPSGEEKPSFPAATGSNVITVRDSAVVKNIFIV